MPKIEGAMTLDEFIAESATEMSEKTLQTCVLKAARFAGFHCYHTFDSRRSEAGFPDLVCIHKWDYRMFVAELKREGKHPTPAQVRWLDYFDAAGIKTFVWKPSQWLDGTIQRILEAA